MKHFIALAVLLGLSLTAFAEDIRLQPLKNLNGYFPFTPPRSLPEWEHRKEDVRRQILVAAGLWPMPTKTPLGAVIHGRIDCDGYTVEKVYFESAPGLFVTGNLYRPKNIQGRVPGVMFAHGHRENARLYLTPDDTLRKSIADGAERFERAGRSTYQSQCRQLARMGCVVWLDSNGKSALRNADGSVKPAVMKLVQGGAMVVGADLLFQGGEPVTQTRVVENPREFAGYTFGYNHALFAQRTHDVLSIVSLLRKTKPDSQPTIKTVAVAGWGDAGPIVAAARAVAGEAIDRAAVDTGGFRFGKLLDYRHPMFLPGGAKYLDLPGMIALAAPQPLWLVGEGKEPETVAAAYRGAPKADALATYTGDGADKEASAVQWLLE